jgi:hypothetical protein
MHNNIVRIILYPLATFMYIGAAFGDSRPPIAPWNAPTVEQFLPVCAKNIDLCEDEVREALLDKLDLRDAPEVCITGAHFFAPVIDWLRRHPETYHLKTEDGIYAAFKGVYPCH